MHMLHLERFHVLKILKLKDTKLVHRCKPLCFKVLLQLILRFTFIFNYVYICEFVCGYVGKFGALGSDESAL